MFAAFWLRRTHDVWKFTLHDRRLHGSCRAVDGCEDEHGFDRPGILTAFIGEITDDAWPRRTIILPLILPLLVCLLLCLSPHCSCCVGVRPTTCGLRYEGFRFCESGVSWRMPSRTPKRKENSESVCQHHPMDCDTTDWCVLATGASVSTGTAITGTRFADLRVMRHCGRHCQIHFHCLAHVKIVSSSPDARRTSKSDGTAVDRFL